MSSIAFSAHAPSFASSARSSKWGYAKIATATVVAAVLANIVVYLAGDAVVGYNPDFVVRSNVSGAVIFTLAAAAVAVLHFGALLRWTANPVRIFNVISAIVIVGMLTRLAAPRDC